MPSSATQIPARLIFLWTGQRFPWHARLAVESALLACPNADVELHTFGPSPEQAPHFRHLLGYARVSHHRIDLDTVFDGIGATVEQWQTLFRAIPSQAHSARSNLLRYAVLYHRGGVYLDFDVLLVRDFGALWNWEAFVGQEQVWVVDEHRVAGRLAPWMVAPTVAYVAAWLGRRADAWLGGYDRLGRVLRPLDARWAVPNLNNAVLGAVPRAPWIRRVLEAALQADPTIRYDLGPTLVTRVWRQDPTGVKVLPPNFFYCEPPSYSFRFFESRPWELPAETVLLHYVSSNHSAQLRELDATRVLAQRHRAPFFLHAATTIEGARLLPRSEGGPTVLTTSRAATPAVEVPRNPSPARRFSPSRSTPESPSR